MATKKVNVTLTPERVSLGPGETAEFVATIHNTSDVVEAYSVDVQGIDPAWSKLSVSSLSLFPGDKETVRIQVTPPVSSSAKAGSYPVSVRVISKRDPAIGTIASFILDLGKMSGYELALLPKRLRGRKGHFQLAITNSGNTVSTYKLEGSDPDDICDFRFKSDTVAVDPGTTKKTPVIVNPRKKPFTGASRSFGFLVKAVPLEGEPKEAGGELDCRPLLPKWAIPVIGIGVAALIAIIVLLARGCGGGGGTHSGLPTILSITPNHASQGQTLTEVTIDGANFIGATAVNFGSGITTSNLHVVNATQITASISITATATLGAKDVLVTTPAGTGTKSSGFTVSQALTVANVAPNSGTRGTTVNVTITGTGFISGETHVGFRNSFMDVTNVVVVSATQITADFTIESSAPLGPIDVVVSISADYVDCTGCFQVK